MVSGVGLTEFSETKTVNNVFLNVAGTMDPEMTPVDDDRVKLPPNIDNGGEMVYVNADVKVSLTKAGMPGMAVFAT